MYHSIKHSERDYYLEYLNIGLYNPSTGFACSGRFSDYLNKYFNIRKLPYNIKIYELIESSPSMYDAHVNIPNTYFHDWKNFPELPIRGTSNSSLYNNHNIYISPSNSDAFPDDMLHPYKLGTGLKFIEDNSTNDLDLTQYNHENGRLFIPGEIYLSYWRCYIILETLGENSFIEKYKEEESGKSYFIEEYQAKNQYYTQNYKEVFDRLALYRSFTTRLLLTENNQVPSDEAALFLREHLDVDISTLKNDLEKLLTLYRRWEHKYTAYQLNHFKTGLQQIKRDIYFMYRWLVELGEERKSLIDKWSNRDRQASPWVELSSVLEFEDIGQSNTFSIYTPIYSRDTTKWFEGKNLEEIYSNLESLDSFPSWIRSFDDLHKSINRGSDISFHHPRVLDRLLVMTIRSEIIFREIYKKRVNQEVPDNLIDVIRGLGTEGTPTEDVSRKVFQTISDQEKWKKTELRSMPERIFSEVDAINAPKRWRKDQVYFLKQIMRFVTSRNYFAHHSYLDYTFENPSNRLCGDILVACLHSIIFLAYQFPEQPE